ncbi:MAG: FAD-dependent oxidoreductase [Actinomycetaceae bacterium]|nr:FAD-dependent oxidoreductase [Actinomycetaceae bacterium]
MTNCDKQVDVIVVGAGPAGAATAYHLAQAGFEVLVLDKAVFPRNKTCGDGLTPAAVRELLTIGINPVTAPGYQKNTGLVVIGAGHKVRLPWSEQNTRPGFGSARPRLALDWHIAERARSAGAHVWEACTVTEALLEGGRAVGVRVRRGKEVEPKAGDLELYEQLTAEDARIPHSSAAARDRQEVRQMPPEFSVCARLVVDAGGVAARVATGAGRTKATNRPLGVAVRTYFKSPRGAEMDMESQLELWDGTPGKSNLLPGYGWMFPLGNGLVNVGLGSVSSSSAATKLPYRKIFDSWTKATPTEWGFCPENQVGPLQSAALPMAFNRKPHYEGGLAIVGDAAGMVSPFNGEGIAPGMAGGRFLAAAAVQAFGRGEKGFDKAMNAFVQDMAHEWGGYYRLGTWFVKLIERPQIMQVCTRYGLPINRLMVAVHKLLSDGYERSGGQIDDKIIATLARLVPKV